eukprot:scaffold27570_cov34-Tisochrysis_lutea.AAC.2
MGSRLRGLGGPPQGVVQRSLTVSRGTLARTCGGRNLEYPKTALSWARRCVLHAYLRAPPGDKGIIVGPVSPSR